MIHVHLCLHQGSDAYLPSAASQNSDISHHHICYKQPFPATKTKTVLFISTNGKLCSFTAPTSDWSDEDWEGERGREKERRKKEQQEREKDEEETKRKTVPKKTIIPQALCMTPTLKKKPYPLLTLYHLPRRRMPQP